MAGQGAIINVFAGIPADKTAVLDLDSAIDKQLYFVGTSGSTLGDMKCVLAKVVSRQLDTNLWLPRFPASTGPSRASGRSKRT